MTDTKVCSLCQFCLQDDYGYSNYTTEGSTFHCLLGLNPALEGQEEQYTRMTQEMADALDVAKTCPSFLSGAPVTLDVDREGLPDRVPRSGYRAEDVTAYVNEGGAVAAALASWLNREER